MRDPQRQAASPPKPSVILRPVPHPEPHLRDVVSALGVVLVRHGSDRKSFGQFPPAYSTSTVSTQQRREAVRGFKIASLSSFRFCLKPAAYPISSSFSAKGYPMASHAPPIPPANRNKKELGAHPANTQDLALKHAEPQNSSEQGDTANIKQNTTNKGFFQGRRLK
jgi:hypothetical protein